MKLQLSVRFYLGIIYALFVLVVLGAVLLYWYSVQEQSAETALITQLKERAMLLATLTEFDQLPSSSLSLPASVDALNSNLRVVFLTPDLEAVSLSDQELTEEQISIAKDLGGEALRGEVYVREIYSEDHSKENLYAAAPVRDEDRRVEGAVCLILPLEEFEATLGLGKEKLLLFVGLMSFSSLLLGGGVATYLTNHISHAKELAARVADGDYSIRLQDHGPAELAELAGHLNRMTEELDKQNKIRQVLLASVTHELARPLGGLRLGVDSLRAGALQDANLAEDLLNEMYLSLKRMEALIDDLTIAARPSDHPVTLHCSPVAVEPLLFGLKSRFWPLAESRGIHLSVDLSPDLPEVSADEMRLNQILSNLLDNALKFTPAGGQVRLAAKVEEAGITLIVEDDGLGIPELELQQIFQPFYQGSHTQHVRQGLGLGLTIVKQLVDAHGGILELRNIPGGGLHAGVRLSIAAG